MRGDERGPDAAARAVHGDHPSPPFPRGGERACGGGRAREGLALGRPEVVATRARGDRRAQRRDRLARLERQQGAAVELCAGRHRGLRDHGIGLELADGLGELPSVAGRPHHAGPSGAVEEVHHLLGHVVLLQPEDHPRHVVHLRSPVRPCASRATEGGGAATIASAADTSPDARRGRSSSRSTTSAPGRPSLADGSISPGFRRPHPSRPVSSRDLRSLSIQAQPPPAPAPPARRRSARRPWARPRAHGSASPSRRRPGPSAIS